MLVLPTLAYRNPGHSELPIVPYRTYGWDYLPFRLWIGVWTTFFLFLILVTDASVCIVYITRFTEESFATLVALIFIKKAISKVSQVWSFLVGEGGGQRPRLGGSEF